MFITETASREGLLDFLGQIMMGHLFDLSTFPSDQLKLPPSRGEEH